MKKHLLLIGLFVFVFSGQGKAEKPIQISVKPSIGHGFGETEYILNLTGYQLDENGDVITDESGEPILFQVKSQLEYPLDVAMGGVTVGLAPTEDPSLWSVKAGIFTSFNDPGGIMKDHDWFGVPGNLTKFSYTESKSEMNSVLVDFEATRRIMSPGKVRVAALVGFRYHRLEQELFGVDGWQRQFGFDAGTVVFGDPVFFDTLQTTQVLYYEIKYIIPQVGLLTNFQLSPNLLASVKTALALARFKDVDDHPLRKKLSEADGTGAGFIGSLSARYLLRQPTAGAAPYIGFSAEYTTLTASGDQTQTWYGDDPASTEDDTGVSLSGIPHDVSATWYHIGLNIGLSF